MLSLLRAFPWAKDLYHALCFKSFSMGKGFISSGKEKFWEYLLQYVQNNPY
jgi:hypothetical protein